MSTRPGPRRVGHHVRRQQHRAIRQSAYCRRLTKEYEKEYAHQVRHSAAWWKWYHSPRQVAKRRRAKLLARRRKQARVRREKKILGKRFVAFAPCPGVVAFKARERALKRKEERAKKLQRAKCRKAQRAATSAKSSKALKARKAGKSVKATKARSGRTRC